VKFQNVNLKNSVVLSKKCFITVHGSPRRDEHAPGNCAKATTIYSRRIESLQWWSHHNRWYTNRNYSKN